MSNFRQRLYDHEVKPPADGWEKLSAALDAGRQHDFPARLYEAEQAPPPAMWDRISAALDQEPVTATGKSGVAPDTATGNADRFTVTPLTGNPDSADRVILETEHDRKRRTGVIPMVVRYAAAAVLLAAVATTAFFALTDKGDGQAIADQPALTTPPVPVAPAQVVKDSGNNLPSRPAGAVEGIAASGAAVSNDSAADEQAADNESRGRVVQVSYNPRRAAPVPEDLASAQYQNPLYAYDNPAVDIAERYITLMTPDGDFIRMSKKLGPLVCCVTGQEQDDQCRSQIRRLQQELATSPVGQGNVLDVLDMVNSLNTGTGL